MNKQIFRASATIVIIVASLAVRNASAQSIPMSMPMHHSLSSSNKNIYLAMMDTMMVKMDDVPKVSSPESDFIWQMIPHHEGAIAMAKYEIGHGKDFTMIQLAKSILAEQTIDIQQMKLWVSNRPTATKQVPIGYGPAMNQTMVSMMDSMPSNSALKDIDHAFAQVMIPHHQAAVDMAKVILKYSKDMQTTAFAKQLISAEEIEIEQMSQFIKLNK